MMVGAGGDRDGLEDGVAPNVRSPCFKADPVPVVWLASSGVSPTCCGLVGVADEPTAVESGVTAMELALLDFALMASTAWSAAP